MAIPLYNVGTATLTKGSAAMTGQGTQWQGSVRPYDQVVGFDGSKAFVQSVNSNTSITLTRAWQGVAQAAQPYDILFTPDAAFLQEEARAVFAELRASALLKLGAVAPAARKLVHFNATADAALADLTDFGLNLLASSNVFGWGADNASVLIPNNNADTLTLNGLFRAASSTIGIPVAGVGQVIHMGQGGNVAGQLFLLTTTGGANRMWARSRDAANVWTPWVEYARHETGTFTPSLEGLTVPGTHQHVQQQGRYIKTGTQVFCTIYLVTPITGADGQLRINGLPFTRNTAVSARSTLVPAFWSGFNLGSSYYQLMGFLQDSGASARLYKSGQNNGTGALVPSDVTGTVTIYANCMYEAAA